MKIKSKLFVAFSSIVALTIILGIISYDNADRVGTDYAFLVEHDLNVLQNAQELRKLVVDAETGQRGFIITGDNNFLQPYYSGVSHFEALIQVEKNLVSDNPSQVQKLETISKLFDEWQTKAAIPEIKAKRALLENPESLANPAELLIAGTGKNISDQIRAEFKEFIEIENDLKDQRFLHASKIELETKAFTVGIVITIAGSASIIGFLLYRSILNPLTKLRNAAEVVTRGDYNVELKPSGSDELSDLTLSFSKMTKYLKSTQNNLKDKMIDLQQINERLVKSEQKFRDLYETSPDLYRSINPEGKILNCNQRYAQRLQYKKEEVIGASIFDHVSEDTADQLKKSFKIWKQRGISNNHEVQMKRKDGSTFPALISATSIYDENGNLIASNTTIKDLTEINKAKEQIQEEKTKRLMAIGELSARIAHDLRNPMSVIKNTLELVEMELDVKHNKKIQNKFERINRAIVRINHQVENVLDFVRDKPLQFENTSLSLILNFVIDKINVPSNVTINLPKNDVKIYCDFEKLEIVFINLITNAIQSMSNKGEINIRFTDKESQVIIEIQDSGLGIFEEDLSAIFDPLFTTRQVGTGLGLPSCKNIVEKHGGTIEAKSRIGEGATFVIKLPKKLNLVTVDTN